MLNNQPMGFYHPATLVKDAQRHGAGSTVDVQNTRPWECASRTMAACGSASCMGRLREESVGRFASADLRGSGSDTRSSRILW